MNHAFGLLNVISQDQLEGILSTFDQLSFFISDTCQIYTLLKKFHPLHDLSNSETI